jgi:predicted nucleotidyltransferase
MIVGLAKAGVEFVVVGGIAGTIHGSPIITNDLDVCYNTTPENIERLVRMLQQWQPYPREWESGLPFQMDSRTFSTTPLLTLRTSEGDLDFLDAIAGVGTYERVLSASEEIEAFGVRVKTLRLRALIDSKRAAGRSRDLMQLPTLEALENLKLKQGR